jgi:uncharacterized membrane protein YidH (DUF202 family)
MAWIRTSLSIVLAGGAGARLALLDDQAWSGAVSVIGSVAGLASIVLWWRRARHASSPSGMSSARAVAAPGAVLAAVVAVCCLGVAAFGLSLALLVG